MEQTVSPVFNSIGTELRDETIPWEERIVVPRWKFVVKLSFVQMSMSYASWDFGMMDGSWRGGEALYKQRAGLNPSRPILVAIMRRREKEDWNNNLDYGHVSMPGISRPIT
jgi:hypothetical protein